MPLVDWLLVGSLVLLTMSLLMSLYNRFRGPHLRNYSAEPTQLPTVSVLIPARDEAANLAVLLPMLQKSRYPIHEILVLDDHSEDQTFEAATRFGANVRRGTSLPADWTGKNWACWQLASAATGEILLFMDADVQPGPLAIERTVQCMQQEELDALSVFPNQIYPTSAVAAVGPFIMELPINSWLPLCLVSSRRLPYFTAANGQWMAIRRQIYDRVGGHNSIRNKILDDMELAKNLRRAGKFQVVIGADDISVCMYPDFRSMRLGFSKNLYLLVGGNVIAFTSFLFFFAWVFLVPIMAVFFSPLQWGMALLAVTLIWRVVVASTMRTSLYSCFLHPVGVLGALYLLSASALRHWSGTQSWKGRGLPEQ